MEFTDSRTLKSTHTESFDTVLYATGRIADTRGVDSGSYSYVAVLSVS